MRVMRSWGTLIIASLLTTGCLAHRAPHKVKAALEEQLGEHLKREVGVKLGWASTRLVASFAGHEDDSDDSVSLGDLTGVTFAVYSREKGGSPGSRLDPSKMGLGDWEPVVRIRDASDQVLILTKTRRGGIRKLMFIAVDSNEVVVGSLRGKLDHFLEAAMRGAEEGGAAGARRAVNVQQAKHPIGADLADLPRGPKPTR